MRKEALMIRPSVYLERGRQDDINDKDQSRKNQLWIIVVLVLENKIDQLPSK